MTFSGYGQCCGWAASEGYVPNGRRAASYMGLAGLLTQPTPQGPPSAGFSWKPELYAQIAKIQFSSDLGSPLSWIRPALRVSFHFWTRMSRPAAMFVA